MKKYSFKNIIVLITIVMMITACSSSGESHNTELVKDHLPKDMLSSGSLHNGEVYIPYPLQEQFSDRGVPYAIAKLGDNKIRFVNDDPTNLCNKGNPKECTTYNDGWIESLLVTDKYLISIEDSLVSDKFEGYLTIRDLNGSNRKEIMQVKNQMEIFNDFQVQSDDVSIYFVLEDTIYQYVIDTGKLNDLTEAEKMSHVSNLKLSKGTLYFSVSQYEQEGVKYATSVLSYDTEFNLLATNIEGTVFRVLPDKYFIQEMIGEMEDTVFNFYINYYDDKNVQIPIETNQYITALSINDYIITLHTDKKDDQRIYYLSLYNDSDKTLTLLDTMEIATNEWLHLWGIENNKIILGVSEFFKFGSFMEAITVNIKDDKLSDFKQYYYEAH